MKYFAEYGDDALPGEIYTAAFGKNILFNPQAKVDYMTGEKFKFKPKEAGDLFQRFLALQSNPEVLFTATAKMPDTMQSNPEDLFMATTKMPDTPFGNLSQYMGG
jgi:hypothetical protein